MYVFCSALKMPPVALVLTVTTDKPLTSRNAHQAIQALAERGKGSAYPTSCVCVSETLVYCG